MYNTERLQISNWGLSEQAVDILLKEPEILEDLQELRKLPPLKSGFQPKVLEIKFDDVVYIRHERGKLSYYHPCSEDFVPMFSEYKLDGETILFHVDGEVVVDRTDNLDLEQILKSLQLNREVKNA